MMIFAYFWDSWGLAEWGFVVAVITAMPVLSYGLSWSRKMLGASLDMAENLALLPKTTQIVAGHTTRIDANEKEIEAHDHLITDHGLRLEVLEKTVNKHDKTFTLLVKPEADPTKETIRAVG